MKEKYLTTSTPNHPQCYSMEDISILPRQRG